MSTVKIKPVPNEYLKTWAARLELSEAAMAAYLGVPVFTYRKWENGTRTPDAAPQRLMRVLRRIESEAPELHAHLIEEARAGAPDRPTATPKRGRKGKAAPATENAPSDPPADAPAPPAPWIAAAEALPDWMKT